ncbi:aggregation-promoting factor C-terminal-like domain-containing protein [Microbacterium gilvum]|uniref:aggregation-promoting factor C-terminal-like domain-containing protein n=1 Tax=Microbacterium gilvum TaxID=1336204 RepID=UPI0031EED9C8
MTSGPEQTRALTRREARAIASQHAALLQTATPKPTRRRRAMSLFAALCAFGLLGGTLVTTGASMAQAEQEAPVSAFASAADEAQTFIAAADLAHAGSLDFGSYAVYVKPTPTPTPTPQVAEAGSGDSGGSDSGDTGWTAPFVAPDPGTAQAIAYDAVVARGWDDNEFACLVALWNRESGWNASAYNPSSGAYGIPQALPGDKMAANGADWQTNPATQIAWGLDYISGRYGTPCGAWGHSESVGWY